MKSFKRICLVIALLVLSSDLFAGKPVINVHKKGGEIVQNILHDKPYVGFDEVITRKLQDGSYSVRCLKPGILPCVVVIGNTSYQLSPENNTEITYDFDAKIIEGICNEIMKEIDALNIENTNIFGDLSRKVTLNDLNGFSHYINFTAAYNLDKNGDGEINFFINTFKL